MRGHNISLHREIWKIIQELSSIPPLICSSEDPITNVLYEKLDTLILQLSNTQIQDKSECEVEVKKFRARLFKTNDVVS